MLAVLLIATLGVGVAFGHRVTLWIERRNTVEVPSPWESKVRSVVLVSLLSDTTFRGVLWEVHDEFLVLRDADLFAGEGPAPSVDGELLLERHQVDYIQVLP